MLLHERAREIRHHSARMDGHGCDGGVLLRQHAGEEDVGELGLAVSRPGVVVGHVGFAGLGHESGFGGEFVAFGGEVDDPDVGVGLCGGFFQNGKEELGEEGVADVVCAELCFVAVFCEAGGLGHYAGRALEDYNASNWEITYPALFIRMSNLWFSALNVSADFFTEARDWRSSSRKWTILVASGTPDSAMCFIAVSYFSLFRAHR